MMRSCLRPDGHTSCKRCMTQNVLRLKEQTNVSFLDVSLSAACMQVRKELGAGWKQLRKVRGSGAYSLTELADKLLSEVLPPLLQIGCCCLYTESIALGCTQTTMRSTACPNMYCGVALQAYSCNCIVSALQTHFADLLLVQHQIDVIA